METKETYYKRKQIASRLKNMRRFLKLTREEVATYLKIAREQYKDIETGNAELVEEHLNKLDEFGFDASYVLNGVASMDDYMSKAFAVMPDDKYYMSMDKKLLLTLPGVAEHLLNKGEVFSWGTVSDGLSELVEYGKKMYHEKELREAPEIRFFTDQIEDCS